LYRLHCILCYNNTRWFKYDQDWFFLKNHNYQTLTCTCQFCLVYKKNQSRSYLNHLVFMNCSWVVTRWQWSFYIVW
jgi:hypothetical protein